MKQTLILFFALAVTMCNAQLDSKTTSYIDSLMNAAYKPNEPGAVILVAQEGKVLFRKAYGMANLDTKTPINPENNFEIASVTKQFTAVCILQLLQQGKIKLDDDITKYIPTYNMHGKHITIEHLLTHTSGIIRDFEEGDYRTPYSQEEIITKFQEAPLQFEPGAKFSYSNTGYYLLAVIIEKVSHLSMEQYLQKNIFDVIGMTHTYIAKNNKVFPELVTGYEKTDEEEYKVVEELNWHGYIGMGNLISNADDMLKWDEALYTNKLLDQKWIKKAHTSYVLKNGTKALYGYGWQVQKPFNGLEYITHSGALPGFLTDALRMPSKHLYTIVMTNNLSIYPDVAAKIAFKVAGQPLEIPKPIMSTTAQLKEYEGVFLNNEDESNPIYTKLFWKENALWIMGGSGREYELMYAGNDLFYLKENFQLIQFHRNPDKKIHSMEDYFVPSYGSECIQLKTDLPYKSYNLLLVKLKETITKNGIDSAIQQYHELKNDPNTECAFEEMQLNILGYELLRSNKLKEAISIFKLNVMVYPDRWNVYDSLAEGYMFNGEDQLAIENYEKSIALNPENTNGIIMLKKLKEM